MALAAPRVRWGKGAGLSTQEQECAGRQGQRPQGQEHIPHPPGGPGKARIGDSVFQPLVIQYADELIGDDGVVHPFGGTFGALDAGGVDAQQEAVFIHQRAAGIAAVDVYVHLEGFIAAAGGLVALADNALGQGDVVRAEGAILLIHGGYPRIAQGPSRLADVHGFGRAQLQGDTLFRGGGQPQDGDILFLGGGIIYHLRYDEIVLRRVEYHLELPLDIGIKLGIGIRLLHHMTVGHNVFHRFARLTYGPAGAPAHGGVPLIVRHRGRNQHHAISGVIGLHGAAPQQPQNPQH